ncbi:MAG: hypothetical protein CMM01_17140 [Rhodopirellula sp.]|nr:hypothetical protein [Rhodopirellula sp.]OUX50071.1 MAG: hypothetical protein CBE43_07875 [Rhodopirellula sp. TMED283]
MTPADFPSDRRRFLVGAAAVVASLEVGCSEQKQVVTPAAQSRQNVPLRVLLVGETDDENAISRGWQAVSEQELQIDVLPLDRADSSGIGDALLARSKKADVAIYPLLLVGEAARNDAVVEMTADEVKRIELEVGPLFPTARNGGARYGGTTYALPLGCALPAVVAQTKVDPLESWEDYDQLVETEWARSAAEPTAAGWAGMMFLWRCSGIKNWLFERKSLKPLVNTEPYVTSLELMLRTNERYAKKDQTPDQIWALVGEGELAGGIGFPARRSLAKSNAQVFSLPGVIELSRIVLDPFSPVVSLSASCRQTTASKRFIQWLCGGEGSRLVRGQVAGMTDLRGVASYSGASSPYDEWLAEQLQAPLTAPCPQLNGAPDYLVALDENVRRALNGEVTAQKAMDEVAEQWADLTSAMGRGKQMRAWRMAQGLRA